MPSLLQGPSGPPASWRFVAEVPEKQGESLFKDWTLDFKESLFLGGIEYKITGPLFFSLVLSRDSLGVKVEVNVKASVSVPCCRCLSPLELALDEDFVYRYVSGDGADELDDGPSGEDVILKGGIGKTMDLSLELWECLVVSMPPFPLCRGGCELPGPLTLEGGVCPDPRLQILADFNSDSPKGGK